MPYSDITKTGGLNYRDLQKQNNSRFDSSELSDDDLMKLAMRKGKSLNSYSPEASQGVGLQAAEVGYGKSQYDKGVISTSQLENLQDVRYENQPWYDTLANGLGKMLGTAGTTFVSSLVGLPYGLFEAAEQGRWSALWDNSVTQGLADVDKWLEENMTNYKSTVQQNSPWYSSENLLSMNFIADDFIKNVGFTLGAAASMAVGSGTIGLLGKSLGLVNNASKTTKGAVNLVSSLFAATGEGMIEARQGVEERNKLENQRLEDALAPYYSSLELQKQEVNQRYAATGDYNTYKSEMQDILSQQAVLDQRKAEGQKEIEESGKLMGNKILLANQGILTLGNLIQFSKGMTKSFDRARHVAETTSKAPKPFLATAERVGNDIKQGYKVTGKWPGRIYAGAKGLVTEGSEEMNQQWAQNTAGYLTNRKDVNDYWKARMDPKAFKDTSEGLYTFGEALDKGFKESWGDVNQWQQFLIGGLTGMAGIYMPNKVFNQDKTKSRLNPFRYGSWEGGSINNIRDFNNEYSQYEENIDDVNKVLAQDDFPSRIRSMVGHTYTESEKEAALDANDKKAWKDADDKQAIHDIQAFLRAGKLDDLRAIYNEIGKEMDDEAVDSIYNSTTKNISPEEDKQNFDRRIDEQIAELERRREDLNNEQRNTNDPDELHNIGNQIFDLTDKIIGLRLQKDDYVGKGYNAGPYVDEDGNRTVSRDEIRNTVRHNAEELNRKLDSYLDSIAAVNKATRGRLTKDQEDNLAYLHNLGKESIVRAEKTLGSVRKQLPSKFLLKTEKSPEQLSSEYATSDLVFSKDDNTKEGYVEVDTSLMQNDAFTRFFVRDILWGGNIIPEFGETADEKAAREEEEKYLSAEERKERRRAEWQKSLDDAKKDAQEQSLTNTGLMINGFLANYMKDTSSTWEEAQEALNGVLSDVSDAVQLVAQAGEYYNTLHEYMANPEKVDQDRDSVSEEAERTENTRAANDTFEGKTPKEIKRELTDGEITGDTLNAFLEGVNNGSITPEDETVDAVKEAKNIADKQNSVEGFLSGVQNATVASDAATIAQWAGNSVDTADAFNYETLSNFDAGSLITDREAEYMASQGYTDIQIAEQAEARKQNALNALAEALEALNKDEEKGSLVPDAEEGQPGTFDFGDTGSDETAKSPSNLGNESAPPAPNPVEREPQTVSASAADAAMEESERQDVERPSNNGGMWRSTTRRYGRRKVNGRWSTVPVPYHETQDKNSYVYKRSKAIYEYLQSVNAFENSENASNDRIKPGDTVRLRIKSLAEEIFGKPLSELSDEEKKDSMVILMEDTKGNILGDLPYPKTEPRKDTEEGKMLQALYDNATDKLLSRNANNGMTEARLDGEGGLNMKFENGTPVVGEIFEVMKGVVPYITERIPLNEIAGKDTAGNVAPFGLAIKVVSGQINIGPKKQVDTVAVGKPGQPYMLIPDASGSPSAVPFSTPEFNADNMRDTMLYRLLEESFTQLERYSDPSSHKDERNKAISTLCSLLQLEKPFLNTDNKDNITLVAQNMGSTERRVFTVPRTDNWKHELLRLLNGTPIQISLSKINGNISLGGISAAYNEVIGEVAVTNVHENTRHTVASWFTIKNFSSKKERTKRTTYPTGTTVNHTLPDGRTVVVSTGNVWYAADVNTGEVIVGDDMVNHALAEMQAENRGVTEGAIKVDINGDTRTYDVKTKTFREAPKRKPAPVASTDSFAADIAGAFDGWNPGTEEEAAAFSQTSGTSKNGASEEANAENKPQEKRQEVKRFSTVKEAEEAAKRLKVLDPRKTQYAWNQLSDAAKIAFMNGSTVTISMGTQTKTLSLNSIPETIKILQEWNKAAKDNPGNFGTQILARKADDSVSKADIAKERRWLQKNLPMFNTEERLIIVNNIIKIPGSEEKAWGIFEKGVITLSEAAARGTTYHEAFHAVTQTILNDEQLDNLYENAMKYYKESDPAVLEELLAEDFRKYVQREETPIIGPILRVFRKLLNAIRNISGYNAPIHQLFYKINNGEFASANPMEANSMNAFYRRLEDRVSLDLAESRNKQVQALVADFRRRNSLIGSAQYTGNAWSSFKGQWEQQGLYPIGHWSKRLVDRPSYVLTDIRVKNGDKMVSIVEAERLEKEGIEYDLEYAARQARKGRNEVISWDRLTPEQQSSLHDSGFSRSVYGKMSLEEKEQVLYCNG